MSLRFPELVRATENLEAQFGLVFFSLNGNLIFLNLPLDQGHQVENSTARNYLNFKPSLDMLVEIYLKN